MSQFQNSDDSYRQYKLVKELRERIEYINDFTDISEEGFCDLCDRKLEPWENDSLICPTCHIIINPKFTIVKHHHSREGPVDDDIIDGNDIPGLSEYYSFQTKREEKDPFIDSLKAQGFQIISSTKK